MSLEAFYSIESFNSSKTERDYDLCIILHKEVVEKLLNSDLKRDENSFLYKQLTERLFNSLGVYDRGLARLTFYEDTWLLKGMQVGQNCACFTSRLNRGSHLRYDPHNLETLEMAAAALSTWLLWFNYVVSMTDLKLPFTL